MAQKIPQGVVLSDAQVQLLLHILSKSYTDLMDVVGTTTSGTSKARAIQLANQVKEQIDELQKNMYAWADVTIPYFYLQGMDEVFDASMKVNTYVNTVESFAKYHRQTIDSLVTAGYGYIDNIVGGASASINRIIDQSLREQILEEVAKKSITGESFDKTQKRITELLKAKGITTLSSNGRNYNAQSYAQMLSRSLLTEAQWAGTRDQMTMDGHDLVIVSDHYGECQACRPWENEILSISGRSKKYTSLDKAIDKGLKHASCRHSITPYFDEFSSVSLVWDTEKEEYVERSQVSVQNWQNKSVKDKLKAYDEFTSIVGLDVYDEANKAIEKKDKKEFQKVINSVEDRKVQESMTRIKPYI